MKSYIGQELQNFELAVNWRNYVVNKISKYINGKEILEIGSGIGSFSKIIINNCKNITLVEPDIYFCKKLKKKFKKNKKIISIVSGTSKTINASKKYEAIIHFQVLEHIKNDQEEIDRNLKTLKSGGYLIICVPSFMSLYSNFDKIIGHYKRYTKKDFLNFNLKKSKIVEMFYLDSFGYILYKLFKIFINNPYPSKFMILIWDKIFIRFSKLTDVFLKNKIGKNLIVVIKKN